MGNRIYIAAGILVIVALLVAFVAPRFWPWDNYRPTLEAMASDALGLEVEIAGGLQFTLLPQPRLSIGEVTLVGPDGPVGTAAGLEADFALTDFMRDRFTVTRLQVIEPQINFAVDGEGRLSLPISLAQTTTASNVSIANAEIVRGRVQVYDQRAEQAITVSDLSGTMQLQALRGPFAFAGSFGFEGARYALDLSTTALNEQGAVQVQAGLRPVTAAGARGSRTRLTVAGLLTTGAFPSFEGSFSYRQPPPPVLGAEEGGDSDAVGDLLFEAQVNAGLERVSFGEFTLLPDENQIGTRLTGTGEIVLGQTPRFAARVNGGVVTLVPPDLSLSAGEGPFELAALLETLPAPPIPPIGGELTLTMTELGIRSLRLREVRVVASIDEGETVWQVAEATAGLPGSSTLSLSGRLGQAAGWPTFSGDLVLTSQALDGLTAMWTERRDSNPLFGQSGELRGTLILGRESIELRNGALSYAEETHGLALAAAFGDQRSLSVAAELAPLTPAASTGLLAMMPSLAEGSRFNRTFPTGEFAITTQAATVAGLALQAASANGRWSPGAVNFDRLVLDQFGGLSLDGAGTLSGSLAAPVPSFDGSVILADDAPILALFGNGSVAGLLTRHLPASLSVDVSAPQPGGAQTVAVSGTAGALELVLDANLNAGLGALNTAPLQFTLSASSEMGAPIFSQFGVPPLFEGLDGALLTASGSGSPSGNMDAEISVEGGGERLDFSGTLLMGDASAVRGQGQLTFIFADMATLMDAAGAPGLYVPAAEGSADLGFIGDESVTLSGLVGSTEASNFAGDLTYSAQTGGGLLSGELTLDTLPLETLVGMTAGQTVLAADSGAGVWPDGPIDIGAGQRPTRGRIILVTPEITAEGAPLVTDSRFEFGWDPQEMRVRGFTGSVAGGQLGLELTLCCTSDFAAKSLSGLMTLDGAALSAVLPDAPAAALEGTLTASARFQGNGETVPALLGSLTGEGSFAVEALTIDGLSPEAFRVAAAAENLVEIAPEELEAQVVDALDSGAFDAGDIAGVATLAGGDIRITNLAIDGEDARLLGGLTLDIATLALAANATLATTETLGGNGLITETTGRIGVVISGPLSAPVRTLDLTQMVDAIQMRALELELEELEQLRLEEQARQAALAAEQARLLEEEARRQAELLLQQQSDEIQQIIEADLAEQEAGNAEPEEEPPVQGVPPGTPFTLPPPGQSPAPFQP